MKTVSENFPSTTALLRETFYRMTRDDAQLLLAWYLEAHNNQISEPGFSEWIQTFASAKDRGVIRHVILGDAAAPKTITDRAAAPIFNSLHSKRRSRAEVVHRGRQGAS
jgi:hypothetical protein